MKKLRAKVEDYLIFSQKAWVAGPVNKLEANKPYVIAWADSLLYCIQVGARLIYVSPFDDIKQIIPGNKLSRILYD